MSVDLAWAGTARGNISDYGIREADSGAVAISIVVAIDEYFDADTAAWVDCRDSDYSSAGDIWVVKKDKTPNTNAIESLCRYAGWDGDLMSVANHTWQPIPCAVVITKETSEKYGDKFRISFINNFDRIPGLVGNVSPDKAKALQDRYGAQFRALAGNVQRNTATPAGKPPVPPPKGGPKSKPAPATKQPDNTITEVGTGSGPSDDDGSIPF